MEKNKYTDLELEIIKFESEDIIANSDETEDA